MQINKSRFLKGFVLICLLFLVAACANKEEKMQKYLSKGEKAMQAGEIKTAIIEFKNATKLSPKNSRSHYLLGKALLENKDGKGAFHELSIASSLDPDNIDAHYQVATVFFLSKKYDDCRKNLDLILQKEPNHFDALVLMANLNLATDNLKAALKSADKAVGQKPDNSRLQILRAKIFEKQKKYVLTEQALRKAISLAPKAMGNYQAMASFYLSQKKIEQAKKEFIIMTNSVSADDKPKALLMLAVFYEKDKELDKANKALEEALKLAPEDVNLHITVAKVYQQRKDLPQAENAYKVAIKFAPKPASIKGMLANLYFEFGKFKKAAAMNKETLDADKANLNGLLVKAKLLLNDNKIEESLALVNKILKENPKSAEASFIKGMAYYSQQNFDLATAAALEAIKYSPRHYKARLLLAEMYLRNNAIDDAKREASNVLRIENGNLRAALILAQCMVIEKDYVKSQKLLSQIQKALPKDPRSYNIMGISYFSEGQLDAAMAQFEKVLELVPQSDKAMGYIINILLKKNKDDTAMQRIKAQAAKFPKNPALLMQQGLLAMKLKNNNLAEQSFRQAIKLAPQLAAPYTMLAAILQKTGKLEEAITQYKTALKDNPDLVGVRMQLGLLLEKQGHSKKASDEYRKILEREPDFAPAANNLAWYLSTHDADMGEALRLAMVAKSVSPEDPNVADTVGWVHYKRGSYGLARTQFAEAQKMLPKNVTVNYHLGLALAKLKETTQAKIYLQKAIALAKGGKDFPDLEAARQLLREL